MVRFQTISMGTPRFLLARFDSSRRASKKP
jgi:hypothetical protein